MKWNMTNNMPLSWELVNAPIDLNASIKQTGESRYRWRLAFPSGSSIEDTENFYINAMKRIENIINKITG